MVKSDGFKNQVLELHLGLNRVGRSPENDFQLGHSSVSAFHCEVYLAADQVTIRDCGSTNGTFIEGEQLQQSQQSPLQAGQILHLGQVELFVESTDAKVAIPRLEVPRPAPPVVLTDGSLLCPRHPRSKVTHQCTHCREVMCDVCVHRLRRRGGRVLRLCPLCSHDCVPLGGEPKKKATLRGFFHKTVKFLFLQTKRD